MTFGTVTSFGKAPVSVFNVGTTAVAADYTTVTENGIKYNVYADHAEVAKQYSKTISGKVVIPAAIKTTNGNIAVTSIGENAFSFCDELTSISLPDSVTRIRKCAFYLCKGLTSISIPEGVTIIDDSAFYYCNSLTTVNLPINVYRIGDRAFSNCESMSSITILDNVTSIPKNAFYKCPNLIISGLADSYAETYAKKNNIPFEHIGGKPASTTTSATTIKPATTTAAASTAPKTQISTAASTNASTNTSSLTTAPKSQPTTTSTSANTTTTTTASGTNPSKINYGDVNNDGKVSVADATAILQYLANRDKFTLSEEGKKNADCYNTGDGVTANDALAIQKLDAKCIDSLPYKE